MRNVLLCDGRATVTAAIIVTLVLIMLAGVLL